MSDGQRSGRSAIIIILLIIIIIIIMYGIQRLRFVSCLINQWSIE